MRINTCQCCNREFEAKYKNKRYCPECDTAIEKKSGNENMRSNGGMKKEPKSERERQSRC